MRVLILGGTKFIGRESARQLAEAGHAVTVFHRGETELDLPKGIKHIHGNWDQLEDWTLEFRQLAPDVVLFMVPVGESDSTVVMRTFKGIAGRMVAISSGDVYRAYGRLVGTEPGPIEPMPLSEDAPLRDKLYPYRGAALRNEDDSQKWVDNYDKILAERAVMGEPDMRATILRLPMVYGPGDAQHRLFNYVKRMDDGRPFILLEARASHWRTARGFVTNVAGAITLAVTDDRSAGRVFNVAEREALSEYEWVSSIANTVGWEGELIILNEHEMPHHLASEGNPEQHLVMDSTRLRCELGYSESVSLDEALAATVESERAHPPHYDPSHFNYGADDAAVAASRQRLDARHPQTVN